MKNHKFILEREDQGPFKGGNKLAWIEWNEDSTFKKIHDKPAVGRSLFLDPNPFTFTWLTTPITEIISETDTEIEFQTENTRYKLLITFE